MSGVTIKICFGDMKVPERTEPYRAKTLLDKIKETIQYIKDEPYECEAERKWLDAVRQKLLAKGTDKANAMVEEIDKALNAASMSMID